MSSESGRPSETLKQRHLLISISIPSAPDMLFFQGGIGECRYLIACDLGPVEVSGQCYQDSSLSEVSHMFIRLPRLCKEPGGILTLSLLRCPLRTGCWSELLIRRKDKHALNKTGPNSKVSGADSRSLLTATGACTQIHLINPWKRQAWTPDLAPSLSGCEA